MNSHNKFEHSEAETRFYDFYERYQRFIFNEAWKYRSTLPDVEDLVQEVWGSLCSKIDLLLTLSHNQVLVYLSTSVRNTAITLSRKVLSTLPLEYAEKIAYDEAALLNAIMDRRLRIAAFRKVWMAVPSRERELLERKYILLESDAEIAHALGIQASSVRMALTRARKLAFSILQENGITLL